ncbi:MAG TPA: hypothetical protein VHO66_03040 [Ruminiclostridium sp.]|nr:hypothetical protein [Ruminiclostridium sp.]
MKIAQQTNILQNFQKIILNIMTPDEYEKLKLVKTAVVPSGFLNAHSIKDDNGNFLITINSRLLSAIYTWNELQIHSKDYFNINFENPSESSISPKDFARFYAPLIDCYLTPNSGRTLPIFDFNQLPEEKAVICLYKTMLHEIFIIAHEYAHIYLNHHKNMTASKFQIDGDEFRIKTANMSQQQELDADSKAVEWIIKLSKTKDIPNPFSPYPLWYIEVLVMLHLIECNTSFPSEAATHPPAIIRLINIRLQYNQCFSDPNYTLDDMILNCFDIESFRMI